MEVPLQSGNVFFVPFSTRRVNTVLPPINAYKPVKLIIGIPQGCSPENKILKIISGVE